MRISDGSSYVCSSDPFCGNADRSTPALLIAEIKHQQNQTEPDDPANQHRHREPSNPDLAPPPDQITQQTPQAGEDGKRDKERKSRVRGKSVSVGVELGGRGISKKTKKKRSTKH